MWKINKSIKVFPEAVYKLTAGGKHKYQLELPRACSRYRLSFMALVGKHGICEHLPTATLLTTVVIMGSSKYCAP